MPWQTAAVILLLIAFVLGGNPFKSDTEFIRSLEESGLKVYSKLPPGEKIVSLAFRTVQYEDGREYQIMEGPTGKKYYVQVK